MNHPNEMVLMNTDSFWASTWDFVTAITINKGSDKPTQMHRLARALAACILKMDVGEDKTLDGKHYCQHRHLKEAFAQMW